MVNNRGAVQELLDEWVDNPKQHKNIINCLVQFLIADVVWLQENISEVDLDDLDCAVTYVKREKQQ